MTTRLHTGDYGSFLSKKRDKSTFLPDTATRTDGPTAQKQASTVCMKLSPSQIFCYPKNFQDFMKPEGTILACSQSPPVCLILSQISRVYIIRSTDIILPCTSRFSWRSLSCRFSYQNFVCTSLLSCECYLGVDEQDISQSELKTYKLRSPATALWPLLVC